MADSPGSRRLPDGTLEVDVTYTVTDTGCWCPTCSLPSAVAVELSIGNSKPTTVTVCVDCRCQIDPAVEGGG